MPNWVENILTIRGPRVREFMMACAGYSPIYSSDGGKEEIIIRLLNGDFYGKFKFNALVPVPENVLQQGYSEAGYYWQIDNWGTKWDIDDEDIFEYHIGIEYACIGFCTAWSPPLSWLKKVSELYPDLHFELKYVEMGCFFAGCMNTYKDCIHHKHYDTDCDKFWEIAEEFGYVREDFSDDD